MERDRAPMTRDRCADEAGLDRVVIVTIHRFVGESAMRENDPRTERLVERLGAASGVVWFLLIMVGNMMNTAGTTDSVRPTGQQILDDLRRTSESTTAAVGLTLELLGFSALLIFTGYVYTVLRRAEGPGSWLPGTALVSGVTMLAIKLGSAGPIFAALLRKDEISPELVRTLIDINSGAFWISWLPFAVLVAATSATILRTGLVARPLGWVGLVVGVAGVVPGVSLAVAMSDFGAAPFLLSAVWLAVVSGVLTIRGPRVPAVVPAPSVPVRA
jgi:hypothetical protein